MERGTDYALPPPKASSVGCIAHKAFGLLFWLLFWGILASIALDVHVAVRPLIFAGFGALGVLAIFSDNGKPGGGWGGGSAGGGGGAGGCGGGGC